MCTYIAQQLGLLGAVHLDAHGRGRHQPQSSDHGPEHLGTNTTSSQGCSQQANVLSICCASSGQFLMAPCGILQGLWPA